MRSKLLTTVALLASVGIASAQNGPGGNSPGSQRGSSPGAQAPASREQAPPSRQQPNANTQRDQTTGQGTPGREPGTREQAPREERGGNQAQSQRGEGERTGQQQQAPSTREGESSAPNQRPPAQSGQNNTSPSQTQQANPSARPGTPQEPRGQAQEQRPSTPPANQQGQTQQPPTQNQAGRQDGASGTVNLTTEQRSRIRSTVFAGNNVPRVNNVNFSLRVGVAVPESVHVVAVPSTLIEIYPDWRDHYYFVTGDDIIIVDRGHKIVAVAPVGTGSSTQIEDRDGGRPGSADHFTVGTAEIRQIQMALRERGFTVEVDGVMGPQTKEALITFQRREGLVATGEVDQKTFASLRGSSGSQQNQTTGQQPSPSSESSPSGQPSRAPGGAQPDNSGQRPNQGPANSNGMNNRPGNNSGANPR